MRRDHLFWGVALTLLGTVLLFQELGWIRFGWNVLWPLFLVGAGLWLLARSTQQRAPATVRSLAIPLKTAERALVRLHHGAGRLQVDGSAPARQLLDGTFGGGVEAQTQREGSISKVDLRVPGDSCCLGFPWYSRGALDWSLGLSRDVDLALDVETGASDNRLDLGLLRVTNLNLRTGASSTTVTLPASAGYTRVHVESGAASVSLRVPEGVAARVRIQSGLSGITVDASRFPRAGDVWRSPDYDTAANKVDMDIQTGVGSVDVR